jgi:hypothetical protein
MRSLQLKRRYAAAVASEVFAAGFSVRLFIDDLQKWFYIKIIPYICGSFQKNIGIMAATRGSAVYRTD